MITSAIRSTSRRLGQRVRDRRDDDVLAAAAPASLSVFHSPRTLDAALPRLVDRRAAPSCVLRIWPPVGKVGPLDVLEQILRLELRIVDAARRPPSQTSPRLCGGMFVAMPTAMPGAAVDEQVRELRRQHDRLLGRAVVVRAQVDRPLLDLVEQLHRERREPGLGVAVGGRRVAVERAEVAVAVDERRAHRERPAPCAPSRRSTTVSPCGWYLPSTSPTIVRALAELGVRVEVQVGVHRVEDAPLHRLEAVAHVGQRARRDDADARSSGSAAAPRPRATRRRAEADRPHRRRPRHRACARAHRRRRRRGSWTWRRPREDPAVGRPSR